MLRSTEGCVFQILCGVLLIDPIPAQFSKAWHSGLTQVRGRKYRLSPPPGDQSRPRGAGDPPPPTHLWRRRRVPVAGQHLQRDAAAAVPQQLLQVVGVAPDLAAVHFADDVADVQHALPVDGAAVQDPRDHHLAALRAERHPLKEAKCHMRHLQGRGRGSV